MDPHLKKNIKKIGTPPPKKMKCPFLFILVSVILSALVNRFSVSRVRDFYLKIHILFGLLRVRLFMQLFVDQSTGLQHGQLLAEMATRWRCGHLIKTLTDLVIHKFMFEKPVMPTPPVPTHLFK